MAKIYNNISSFFRGIAGSIGGAGARIKARTVEAITALNKLELKHAFMAAANLVAVALLMSLFSLNLMPAWGVIPTMLIVFAVVAVASWLKASFSDDSDDKNPLWDQQPLSIVLSRLVLALAKPLAVLLGVTRYIGRAVARLMGYEQASQAASAFNSTKPEFKQQRAADNLLMHAYALVFVGLLIHGITFGFSAPIIICSVMLALSVMDRYLTNPDGLKIGTYNDSAGAAKILESVLRLDVRQVAPGSKLGQGYDEVAQSDDLNAWIERRPCGRNLEITTDLPCF